MALTVVETAPAHLEEMRRLLNQIIHVGGMTAYQEPYAANAFAEKFLHGDKLRSSLVALDADGSVAGFQVLIANDDLPAGWLDIATFARLENKVPGVGTALFPGTLANARTLGCPTITACIRADNTGGLAFYNKLGFVAYDVITAAPLADGTPVDRLIKTFSVTPPA